MKNNPFKRSKWAPGMVYAVPLSDGTYGFAQAISEAMLNVIDVVILRTHSTSVPPVPPSIYAADVISLWATWRQDLNNGNWAALGVSLPIVEASDMPNQKLIAAGSVGVQHANGGLIQHLLNAWHGLVPWNTMHDENYFDSKLAPGVLRPANAIVLASTERDAYRAVREADRTRLIKNT